MRRLIVFLVVMTVVASASAQQPELQPYVVMPENILLSLPAGQCSLTKTQNVVGGKNIEMLLVEPNIEGKYMPTLRIVRFGNVGSTEDRQAALVKSVSQQKMLMEANGGQLIYEKDIALGANAGKELLMRVNSAGSGFYRVRSYYIGGTQVMLSVIAPTQQQVVEGINSLIFDSLRTLLPGEVVANQLNCKES